MEDRSRLVPSVVTSQKEKTTCQWARLELCLHKDCNVSNWRIRILLIVRKARVPRADALPFCIEMRGTWASREKLASTSHCDRSGSVPVKSFATFDRSLLPLALLTDFAVTPWIQLIQLEMPRAYFGHLHSFVGNVLNILSERYRLPVVLVLSF